MTGKKVRTLTSSVFPTSGVLFFGRGTIVHFDAHE